MFIVQWSSIVQVLTDSNILVKVIWIGTGLGSLLLKYTQVKSISTSTKNTWSTSNKYFQKVTQVKSTKYWLWKILFSYKVTSMYTRGNISKYIYIYMCVCVCVYMYIWYCTNVQAFGKIISVLMWILIDRDWATAGYYLLVIKMLRLVMGLTILLHARFYLCKCRSTITLPL